eukprot:2275583-Pyramimonas_sp.AAC.2
MTSRQRLSVRGLGGWKPERVLMLCSMPCAICTGRVARNACNTADWKPSELTMFEARHRT